MLTKTVVAIPPSYTKDGALEASTTKRYLNFLEKEKVSSVMTTAGTSQFNLLSVEEIHELNSIVAKTFLGNKILGIPALSTRHAVEFVQKAESEYTSESTNFIILYPERYYAPDVIKDHVREIRRHTTNPLYVHGMVMRSGYGGQWNYNSEILCDLFEEGHVIGLKEEHPDLKKSYDLIKHLPSDMDVIVAGGSMRRHQFLRSAGANAFLSGIGNLFPEVELGYCNALNNFSSLQEVDSFIELETKLFNVFMKNGWHQSLRIALCLLDMTCTYDRKPWPHREKKCIEQIGNIIKEILDEK